MCKEVKKSEQLCLTQDDAVDIEILSTLKTNKPRFLPQVLAASAISLGGLNIGAVNGWSGGALTQIDNEFDVSPGYLAFVVSAITIGSILGSVGGARITDIFGRKTSVLLTPPILISGWGLIFFSPNVGYISLGRTICGFAVGMLLSTCNVYISELSTPEYRGRLGCINTLCITFGTLLTYIFGSFLNWRYSCFCFIGTSVLLFLCVFLIPESPYWFLRQGRQENAIKSIQWLRGSDYDYTEEINEMMNKIEPNNNKGHLKELLKSRTRIPIFVSLFVQTCQQLCGGNIIMMYTSTVFKNSNSFIDERFGSLYTGISQMIGTIISVIIIDRIGRKPLLTISLAGVAINMFILGISFYMGESWPNWAPLVTILICTFTFCLGLRSIPWIVSSEVLNTSVRSTGTSLCVFYNRLLGFITLQIYPYYRDLVGDEGVFITYGAISLLLAILTPCIVPETNNKSLEEIQVYFENRATKKNKSKNNDRVNLELI